MKTFVSIIFIISFTISLSADPTSISYLSGTVEVQKGTTWEKLKIGSQLDSESIIKITGQAVIEIKFGAKVLSLKSPGIHDIGKLFKSEATSSLSKLNTSSQNKLGLQLKKTDTTIAGVRADPKSAEVIYLMDESSSKEDKDLLDAIVNGLNTKQFEPTIKYIQKAYESGKISGDWLRIQEASCLVALSQFAAANDKLSRVSPKTDSAFYFTKYLLLAQIQLNQSNYNDARKSAEVAEKSKSTDEVQLALLIQALALKQNGDNKKSSAFLEKIKAINPESEYVSLATSLLKS